MIRKTFTDVETKVIDSTPGLVECLFSVTGNVDRQNDVIVPGAFSKVFSQRQSVPVVYAHKWDSLDAVLGKTIALTEIPPGDLSLPERFRANGWGAAKARIQFDQETPAGRLAFTHVKNKNLGEWSWAFTPDEAKADTDDDGARHIKSINEMYEVTLALIGANPETVTMALKAMQPEAGEGDSNEADDAELVALLAAAVAATVLL